MTALELAEFAAPAFWYTLDQPVRPTALPCDAPRRFDVQGVVYWQLLGDSVDTYSYRSLGDGRIDLRFFLYYERDVGIGGHPHDVEYLDISLEPRCADGECDWYLVSAVGSAHDDLWNYNRLMPDSTSFKVEWPLTILVEQGKNAMAVDANRDGRFAPGLDVNRLVNDAWGVRDIAGTGFVGNAGYSTWMTRDRTTDGLIMEYERASVGVPREFVRRGFWSYELRDARAVLATLRRESPSEARASQSVDSDFCGEASGGATRLRNRLRALEFGGIAGPGPVRQFVDAMLGREASRGGGAPLFYYRLSVELQYLTQHVYGVLAPGGFYVPLVGGWIVPRVAVSEYDDDVRWAIQALYAKSASRWADWYLAASLGPSDSERRSEGGLRLRVKGVGVRFGLAVRGFDRLTPSFLVGVGTSPW